MTKSELIMRLAEANPHLYQRDVERIVSTIFEEISQALENGDEVSSIREQSVTLKSAETSETINLSLYTYE